MRIWPDTLPGPIRPGYQLSPSDPSIRTDMEAGARRLRRISTARQDSVAVAWRFEDHEMAAFRAWYGDEAWSLAGDSEALNGWALADVTAVTDGVLGPSGQLAEKIRATPDITTHLIQRAVSGAAFNNQPLLLSATMRAAGFSFGRLGFVDRAGVLRHADVDLAAGTVAAQSGLTSVAVTARGNGWWRVALVATTASGTATPAMRIGILQAASSPTFAGNGSDGLHLCEKMARLQTGADLFLPTGSDGRVLGAAGGSAWFFGPLAFGGGFRTAEARFEGPWQAEVNAGLRWRVSGKLEVRNA